MFVTQKVPVDQLEVGMYIAQLDRPWLDTPFLFQGFYLRNEDEINELQSHCEFVYVHSESIPAHSKLQASRQSLVPAVNGSGGKRNGASRPSFFRRLFSWGRRRQQDTQIGCDQTGMYYKDVTTLKKELGTATQVQSHAQAAVQTVMKELQNNGNLDVAQLKTTVSPMVDSVLRNPAAMAYLMRVQKKDDYLYHHCLASSVWAAILGRQIGLSRDDLNVIALGALLLDIGKTRLPDELLHKPNKLTEAETAQMRKHVDIGLELLRKTEGIDSRVLEMVEHHHERFNGSGYPKQLQGSKIPVFGRIAGIVDAYDAMISARPYAKPMSSYDALRQLRVLADVEFQAELVEQFTRAIGVFPTGTLVELNSGELAVITQQNRIRRLRPKIMIITDSDKQVLDDFRSIDMNKATDSDDGRHALWIERGLAPGAFGIDPTEFYLD